MNKEKKEKVHKLKFEPFYMRYVAVCVFYTYY